MHTTPDPVADARGKADAASVRLGFKYAAMSSSEVAEFIESVVKDSRGPGEAPVSHNDEMKPRVRWIQNRESLPSQSDFHPDPASGPLIGTGIYFDYGDARSVRATTTAQPKFAEPREFAEWLRTLANACDSVAPSLRVNVAAAFDATDTAQKLASHQHTDMCRVATPRSEMAVFNEMKARVARLQERGISVYAVKQVNDYGQETWYRLMTDRPAEDAEGVPKEVA